MSEKDCVCECHKRGFTICHNCSHRHQYDIMGDHLKVIDYEAIEKEKLEQKNQNINKIIQTLKDSKSSLSIDALCSKTQLSRFIVYELIVEMATAEQITFIQSENMITISYRDC